MGFTAHMCVKHVFTNLHVLTCLNKVRDRNNSSCKASIQSQYYRLINENNWSRNQMKKIVGLILGLLISQVSFAQQTISSLAEFIALQDGSNQNIKMAPGTYHISSETKSLFPGGNWRVNEEGNWPGLLQFSGNNNIFDLTGVTFTFDSTILLEMPSIAHGKLVQLGGSGNVWKGFNLQERPNNGEYGYFHHTSGGAILEVTGANHEFYDLTLKSRFSRPYGLGSIYGKTGSSTGKLPGSSLNKKSGLSINVLDNTYFENTNVDHSGLGHPLVFNGPINNLVFDTVSVIAETRSTNDLIANGVGGTDRNGVPFHVTYNGVEMTGESGKADYLSLFDTYNLNRCQNLDSGNQNAPIKPNFQYSLVEDSFRGYNQGQIGTIEVYNATVVGARSGIALEYASEGMIVDGMTVTGIAGHGVPACGGWNGSNGGEGDATAYGPPSYSVLKNVRADAAYSTIMEINGNSQDIIADIELLDPSNGYNRPTDSTALALLGGDNHKLRIWKRDNKALTKDLIIKVNNGGTDNLLLCNMTQQPVYVSNNVSNSMIYSVGNIDNDSSSSANNTIVKLSSSTNEPDVCKALASSDNPYTNCDGFDAFSGIEAEGFCDMSGVEIEYSADDGGEQIGYINNGEWLEFKDVNFGDGAASFDARISSKTDGGDIELRLGSPTGSLIGTCSVSGTGSWTVYDTVSCDINSVSGVQDLYLVFTGNDGYLMNINWFKFTEAEDNCYLPWSGDDFSVEKETVNYSSGSIDISCASSVEISMDLEGVGSMEDADYLNVYYTVDGGAQQVISENVNAFAEKTVSVSGIRGSNVEIFANVYTSYAAEVYTISNISVVSEPEVAYSLDVVSIVASADDGNVPANTRDGSLDTRWSAKGDSHWITYDLGSNKTVEEVGIAFFRGDQRTAAVSIETSTDNTNWETVYTGEQSSSTIAVQTFDVTDSNARYVRIVGYGNSSNTWNSFTEVELIGR